MQEASVKAKDDDEEKEDKVEDGPTMPARTVSAGNRATPYMLRQPPVSLTHNADARYPNRIPPTMNPSFKLQTTTV